MLHYIKDFLDYIFRVYLLRNTSVRARLWVISNKNSVLSDVVNVINGDVMCVNCSDLKEKWRLVQNYQGLLCIWILKYECICLARMFLGYYSFSLKKKKKKKQERNKRKSVNHKHPDIIINLVNDTNKKDRKRKKTRIYIFLTVQDQGISKLYTTGGGGGSHI